MLHIIPISGKDSLATAIVQKAHHPEIERSIGAEGYTLIKDYPLSRFAETYQEVIERRADQVAHVLYKLAQMNIFEEMPEELSMTSCGMFCGK